MIKSFFQNYCLENMMFHGTCLVKYETKHEAVICCIIHIIFIGQS